MKTFKEIGKPMEKKENGIVELSLDEIETVSGGFKIGNWEFGMWWIGYNWYF